MNNQDIVEEKLQEQLKESFLQENPKDHSNENNHTIEETTL